VRSSGLGFVGLSFGFHGFVFFCIWHVGSGSMKYYQSESAPQWGGYPISQINQVDECSGRWIMLSAGYAGVG
jgi:hypothetical protein